MEPSGTASDVWQNHSSQWTRVGPPLRPCRQDHDLMERVVRKAAPEGRPIRAMVLGVTPEMARLGWPEGTDLLAVDRSRDMIERVWPGFPRPGEGVLQANWLDLPVEDPGRDLVLGDGCFTVIRYPVEHRGLVRSVRHVLRPGGFFAFRTFVHPERAESPDQVHAAALAGTIGSFHAFKLRLLMALQPDPTTGVRTGDAWESFTRDGPGVEALAASTGWPEDQVATIDAYRGQDTVYAFPTVDELVELLADEGFREVERSWPTYELGERCPTLLFRKRLDPKPRQP